MAKKFCTTGTCIPEKNYMVDLSNKIQQIINQYIESGQYFTINRARQYGKTTLLYLLEKELRKQDYLVLSLSFEAADEYFESLGSLAEGLSLDIEECLREQNVDEKVLEEWNHSISERFPMRSLGTKISNLCRKCGKKVVLMIDEVDKSSDNQIFLSFLGLLREKYLKCQQGKDVTFHSVILAGVYDIKTLKLKLHPQEESKYNSPWNIAVDFNIEMSFSVSDIQTMIQEYEQEHRTGMDVKEISRILYDYTSGYPYLVSKICQLLDERVSDVQVWTREGILSAVKVLLKEPNTLFDDMTKKLLDHPQLKEMLQNILFAGVDFPFKRETPIIDLGVTFGFLKDKNGIVAVSNRIFETQLYDMFLSETAVNNQMYMKVSSDRNQFIVSGMLQMPLVMQKFYEYYEEIYSEKDQKFIEETGRGKIMYKISNFSDNDDVKIIDKSGPFEVIEYQRDLSVMPEDAQLAFFCSQMNVRKRQLKCELSRGNVTIQSGAMQWMAGDVSATTGIKGAGDFLSKTIRGKVTGESVIKPEYTGDGTLVLEPTYKHIILLDLDEWGNSIVLDDGLFLACESTLKQKAVRRKTFSSAFAGGEGFFNLGLKGSGVVCIESDCPREELVEITLEDDVVKIDGNLAVAWSGSLDFTVERAGKSLLGSAASGEGLVNVYRGTGKVLLAPVGNQAMKPQQVIEKEPVIVGDDDE